MAFLAALPWLARIGTMLGGITRGLSAVLRSFKATRFGKWIWFGLFTYMGGVIGRMFQYAGVALVATEFAAPVLTDVVAGHLLGLPPDWVQFIGVTKLDQCITIVLSAVAVRVVDQVQLRRNRDRWQAPL